MKKINSFWGHLRWTATVPETVTVSVLNNSSTIILYVFIKRYIRIDTAVRICLFALKNYKHTKLF